MHSNTQKEIIQSLRAPRLQIGNAIGIIASSNVVPKDRLELIKNGSTKLQELGFRGVLGKSLEATDDSGIAAGSPGERAREFNALVSNDDIRMIWCAHGGGCAAQLLPFIDYDLLKAHPKIVSGFSDNVILLNAISAKTGLITFVGAEPKVGKAGMAFDDAYSTDEFLRRLVRGELGELAPLHPRTTVRPGVVTGRLFGGNLPAVVSLLGTQYMPDTKGTILLLESLNVTPGDALQMISLLKNAGIFNSTAGVIVGDFYSFGQTTKAGNSARSLTFESLLDQETAEFDFPILKCRDLGHRMPTAYFPIGATVKLDATKQKIIFEESFVSC